MKTIDAIIAAVAHEYEVTPEEVAPGDRSRRAVAARHKAWRLLRDQTDSEGKPMFTFDAIGKRWGVTRQAVADALRDD